MAEFLPLCDVLFNVISLAGYFCDVVFDVVMSYALLERGYKGTFAAAISIVVTSLLISQVLSIRWYLHVWGDSEGRKDRPPWLPLLVHCLQLGVLWRYARLLVPVELRRVKHQVRDLCMLRLVHAFCEAAPMLLLQLHILFKDSNREPVVNELGIATEPSIDEPQATRAFVELSVVSASLSLCSVCWALASFSKNVREQNVHRLVLTWLGVIFQFLWRLGTISARICALTVYALVYEYWVFLVIGLHWLSMFVWLVSPRAAFRGERLGRARKAALSALLALVYVFAYVNLQDDRHAQKMVTFYCVMCVENSLLVTVWWWSGRATAPARLAAAAAAAFAAGQGFMLLYYRYFHVRRLGYMLGENQQGTNSTNASSQNKNGKPSNQADNIPGVFNCRFTNPVNSAANGRKKKKPTSFVPPPAAFWRRPLPAAHNHHGGSSENEGSSVGSRVNIQQKLQEKKQKQLAELRVIEEEIKQGKLASTAPTPEIYSSLQRQPIPHAKTHYQNYPRYPTYTEIKDFPFQPENPELKMRRQIYDERTFYESPRTPPNFLEGSRFEASPRPEPSPRTYVPDVAAADKRAYDEREYAAYCDNQYGKEYAQGLDLRLECAYGQYKLQRCRTPEILLAPRYLPCGHWGPPYPSRKKEDGAVGSSGEESAPDAARDTPRPPSDIDSQISLPRSYTLPREFRYWRRRPRLRDARVPSNNSSDGDVDSGDDVDSARVSGGSRARLPPHYSELSRALRTHHKPETKL